MTSRSRMNAAMHPAEGRPVDRVPVMCQLALGHYFLHAGADPIDIWHDSATFASALVTMQRRYGFDGILVNLPGRDPDWRRFIRAIESRDGRRVIRWTGGRSTVLPPDDNPRVVVDATGRRYEAAPREVDPDALFYVDPHDLTGVAYPTPAAHEPWRWDALKHVRAAAPELSVHGEVFSPFSQWIELTGCAGGMMALVEDAGKVHACLERLTAGAIALAGGHFDAGADAVLISSAYAGGGLISRRHYETFVLPYERQLVTALKRGFPGRPVYTHTCGAIGDRLDLMEATGTDGVDTLDPPPLGTVDLADARRRLGPAIFIKGNVDPVNTILRGSADECYRDARERIRVAGRSGYILSTACSVPPHAPPANIAAMVRAAEAAA
jgi:uroporphyrinogen-III decarboxylase